MSEQEECVLCDTEVPPVKQSYHVSIDVYQTHSYVIDDVNSPEEAEETAEQYYADGEPGIVEDVDITCIDSYPVEKEEIN